MNRSMRRETGFSLIELAMIMTVVGLVVAVVLQQYSYYVKSKQYGTTETNTTSVATALSNHLFNFGDLPCPASPILPPGDQRAGKAGGNSDPASCFAWEQAHEAGVNAATPYCEANAADDHYGICIVYGQRADPDYGAGQHPGRNDIVLIGAIPYVDSGLTIKQSLDGWGHRIIYAVSLYETQQNLVQKYGREKLGAINIQTFNRTLETFPGDPAAWGRGSWQPAGSVPNAYMYVAFSAGPNGKGAYDYGGKLVAPCTGAGADLQNCNDDVSPIPSRTPTSTFRISGATEKDSVFSLAAGPDYFDDLYMIYDVSLDRDKWSYTSQTAMKNKDGGSVGIGSAIINKKYPTTVLPQMGTQEKYRLDVAGDLKVRNVDSRYICDGSGANCFDQSLLANSGCNGGMLTGFANGKPICMKKIVQSIIIGPTTCPAGPPKQYLTGFTGDCSCDPNNSNCNGTCDSAKLGTWAKIVCAP